VPEATAGLAFRSVLDGLGPPRLSTLVRHERIPMNESIHQFEPQAHRTQVVELWHRVFGHAAAHNAPHFAIDKKLAVGDGLFFVAEAGRKVVGSIMAGYDGHRGWIYSLAVLPEHRRRGLGSRLMQHAEERLKLLGCPKINLQIIQGNEAVEAFYLKLGYQTEQRISMGKKILENITSAESGRRPERAPCQFERQRRAAIGELKC
jgi:ribosomal protein S18 acetylase RimI-like enzyme